VQVVREPFGGKAMRLTARPVLAGYCMLYAPFSETPAVPDGATDAEKQQLQRLLESLGDLRPGMNARLSAIGIDVARLRQEAAMLRGRWAEIKQKTAGADKGILLQAAPDPLFDLLRELGPCVGDIFCDTRTCAGEVAALGQSLDDSLAERVVFRPRREWVPFVAELEEQVDEALADEVVLASGAILHFDETRAMTVIDVDTGQARLEGVGATAERSFLKVNYEAAQEIGRQVRLRNLGGILVIDFIDLQAREHRQKVVEALRTAVAGDLHLVWVGNMSRLGLVELTRQRRGPTLAARLLQDCKTCGSRHRTPREELRPWIGTAL